VVVCWLIVAQAGAEKPARHPRPGRAAAWSLLCPGCGYFYLDRPGTAAAFLAPAAAMGVTGVALLLDEPEIGNPEDPELGPDDPAALQLVLAAQNVWFYGIFAAYRDAQIVRPDLIYRVPRSRETLGDLAAAPFTPRVLARPWVWAGVPLAVGGAIGLTLLLDGDEGDDEGRTLFDDGGVNFFGRSTSKAAGVPLGELYFAGMFVPVAIGEEALFRGTLQPALAERLGDTEGWALASLIFGAAHVFNFAEEGLVTTVAATAYITVTGSYLGVVTMRSAGNLAASMAIHFWYDFLLSTASFIADPDGQPFVARFAVSF
jgi:membrane protease YdiL (CAAX protease family)